MMIQHYRTFIALLFAGIFHLLSLILILIATHQFITTALDPGSELIAAVVKSINTLVISLAMYELGAGVSQEYKSAEGNQNLFRSIRRTITRFVGTVCIALVLEALIMIIKYSQLDLAGNLYYPIAMIAACGVLLVSLGWFLSLTRQNRS